MSYPSSSRPGRDNQYTNLAHERWPSDPALCWFRSPETPLGSPHGTLSIRQMHLGRHLAPRAPQWRNRSRAGMTVAPSRRRFTEVIFPFVWSTCRAMSNASRRRTGILTGTPTIRATEREESQVRTGRIDALLIAFLYLLACAPHKPSQSPSAPSIFACPRCSSPSPLSIAVYLAALFADSTQSC
ncbi:hypothetical protein CC85DRAFT_160940 [Cutaneotrichosporon oleaginosum]|uniref:Uncharacterized protein n=1 Tax=Cutaneotrichosporon oleaginosum TaxID=879819 RepID=A0A0J0XGI8_9TREE|nr:uncharacterized protein CC85DRAFT_160940 [Cutaneotrichosporon oleaginosum]KLT40215.1 hypothetical protein CC85DRAFT_160940 [Cutaneotrichosporon oleaginosum]TXT10495.1 hypothetical protein COLE_04429 [Cutaneotrichosporon oleaginosum]